MKKLLIGLFALVLCFSSFEGKAQDGLALKLANDVDFLTLLKQYETIAAIPNSDKFIAEFNKDRAKEGGEEYVSNLSGYSLSEVQGIDKSISENVKNVYAKFPELKDYENEKLSVLIIEASNLTEDQQTTGKVTTMSKDYNKLSFTTEDNFINTSSIEVKNIVDIYRKTCADCKREGRAQMAAGIFLGAATGSVGGLFGTWIGATLGFWAAAEMTLSCLKEYCK